MSDPNPQNGNPRLMIPWFGLVLIHAAKVIMDILKEGALEKAWHRYYSPEIDIIDEEKPKRLARLMDERDEKEDETLHRQNGHGVSHTSHQK